MTKISKSLEWMREYLDVAIPYLPVGVSISKLAAWSKVGGRYGKGCQACIITNDNETFRIYLHLSRHPRGEKFPTPYTRLELLELLAHELAHTLSWDHTPEHKELESKLSLVFMNRLKQEGYVSSEEEERTKNRKSSES